MFDEGKPEIQIPTEEKIKRPPNSFMLWSFQERKNVSKKFPYMHNSEISKQLGEKWKIIPQETKDIYKTMANELKIKHQKKYPNYKYQRKKKKLSLSNFPITKLFNDKFDGNSPIPNIVPNPYYKAYTNNYAPYLSNATTTAPYINNNTHNNASATAFANNLVYPNYYTPYSSLMSFLPTKPANTTSYWTFPSASDHKSENDDVCKICDPQNSSQLTPSGNQPTRTPLSEYNQQQKPIS